MADLRTGWSGEAADAALSKFAPFQEWAAAAALLAGETAGKAQVQSGSYTFATLAMPSLAAIAAVQAAKVAAYSIGGALVGGAAAAEAAEEALKIRAAVTMETYDAATAHLAVQQKLRLTTVHRGTHSWGIRFGRKPRQRRTTVRRASGIHAR